MALEAVVGEQPAHVGMAGEEHAVEVVGLALAPVGAGEHVDDRRDRRRLVGLDLHADAPVLLGREQMIDHVETPFPRRPIHRRDVDEAHELAALVVAQEGHQLDDVGRRGGDGQLAVRNAVTRDRARQRGSDRLAEFVERIVHLRIPSVYDEESGTLRSMRTVRVGSIGHLVAHARLERERAAVLEIGVQFAVDAKKDVALLAPMVGDVTRRVVDHPHADLAELPGAPGRRSGFAAMRGRLDAGPVGGAERDVADLHQTLPQRSIVPVRRIFFCSSSTP